MMLLNLFKKKRLFKFERDTLDKFSNDDIISEIYSGKRDGVVIQNVFSEAELGIIKEHIGKIFPEKFKCFSEIYSYPDTFASYVNSSSDSTSSEDYFLTNEKIQNSFTDLLGINYTERIETVFSKISKNCKAEVPIGENETGKYPNSTIRVLTPKGRLHTHCGNFFYEPFYKFYKHLESIVTVKNQLSFFVLIQASEAGGELVLFNLRWKNGQVKKEDKEDLVIIGNPDSKDFISNPSINKESEIIKLHPGDMLVFAGGEIWHKVSQPVGEINRITIGGFLGKSAKGDNKLYYWS